MIKMKGRKKWLSAVLAALSVVTVVADMGFLGSAAQRAVGPAVDVLLGAAEVSSGS